MPGVYIEDNELKREQHLIYIGITFDRRLVRSKWHLLGGPFKQITGIVRPAMQESVIDNNLTLDPPRVIQCIPDHLALSRTQASSYTLTILGTL